MAKNVKYTIDLNDLMSKKLAIIESNADRLERKLSNLGRSGAGSSFDSGIKSSAVAAGVMMGEAAFGLIKKALSSSFQYGKDIIETAREFQLSMLRIKNVSANDLQGAMNQEFIMKEAQKYKIPIEDAVDAFSKFLTQVRGVEGLQGADVRSLHDNLLMIGKVTGITSDQMSAATRNLGKMLELGTLDYRHLYPFEQQLSGIGKFIADRLGLSLKELRMLGHEGKLTTISSDVLIKAINDMAKSYQDKLPGTLNTLDSMFNMVHNYFFDIKKKVSEGSGFKSFIKTIEDISEDRVFQRNIVKFGNDMFEIFSKWLKIVQDFVDQGKLDTITKWIDRITPLLKTFADNFELLIDWFVSSKILEKISGSGGSGSVSSYAKDSVTVSFIAAVVKEVIDIGMIVKLSGDLLDDWTRKFSDKDATGYQKSLMDRMGITRYSNSTRETVAAISRGDYTTKMLDADELDKYNKAMIIANRLGGIDKLKWKNNGELIDYQESDFPWVAGSGDVPEGQNPPRGARAGGRTGHLYADAVNKNTEATNKNTAETKNTNDKTSTMESRVTGSRPLNIYINMDSMATFNGGISLVGKNADDAKANIKEHMLNTLNEALIEAEGLASSRNR